uniref:Sulfotransferase domain-containing protein n=1 Tax=Strongyloides stercoralis TaxID=6248 RepID=A0A0K0E002_STRER
MIFLLIFLNIINFFECDKNINNGITTISNNYTYYLPENTTMAIIKSKKEVVKKGKRFKKLKKNKKIIKNKLLLKNSTLIQKNDNHLNDSNENSNDFLNTIVLEKQQNNSIIIKTIDKINFTEKKLSPSYLNTTCYLHTNETPCIPPFQKFRSRFRVDPIHKINYCTITKNFSSMLRAILCFIKKPHYIRFETDLTNRKWTYKFCNDNNFSRRISVIAKNYTNGDVEKLMKEWKHVAFIRDPYERFISGFVDKCLISKEWKIEKEKCYGCRMNVTCILERMYKKMVEKTSFPRKKITVTYDDIHFFPQSWHCEFKRYMNSYTIIYYGSKPKVLSNFYSDFFKFLKENGISNNKIRYIRKYTKRKRTIHATSNLWVRKHIERKIRKNNYLMRLMYLIFYYDYVVFNLPLPSIPK